MAEIRLRDRWRPRWRWPFLYQPGPTFDAADFTWPAVAGDKMIWIDITDGDGNVLHTYFPEDQTPLITDFTIRTLDGVFYVEHDDD